jgi:hypothetical protein
MSGRKFLIGTYTHRCKRYIDAAFYRALAQIRTPARNDIYLTVDNSPTPAYSKSLRRRFGHFSEIVHLSIPAQATPRRTFLNNVALSANELRRRFLASDCDYLVTVEADVIVPPALPALFEEAIERLNGQGERWGMIGGLYYLLHHPALDDPDDLRLLPSATVYSGCTCYHRGLLEAAPFRWSAENEQAFPDTWMNVDAHRLGYSGWLYNKIRCGHKRGRWLPFIWSRLNWHSTS